MMNADDYVGTQGRWSADTSDRAWQMIVGYGLNMNGNVTRHTE